MYKQPIKDLLKQFTKEAVVKTFIIFMAALVIGLLCSLLSGCVGGNRQRLTDPDSGSWEPIDAATHDLDGNLPADSPTDGWELFDGSGGEDAASMGDAGTPDLADASADGGGLSPDAGEVSPDMGGLAPDAGGAADSGAAGADAGPPCVGNCNYYPCVAPRSGWCWFFNPGVRGTDGVCGYGDLVACGGACMSARGCL